jgi:phenylpropionate dioxygenase-like ring-hydroxylating dioxygenase large terminal subunit
MNRIIRGIFLLTNVVYAFNLRSFPSINKLWSNSRLLPLWTPLDFSHNINSNPKEIILDDESFVHYKDKNNSQILIFNNCPHQGAKLSAGKLVDDNLICPYHGFKFKNGRFNGLPMSTKQLDSPVCVPRIPLITKNDMVYFLPFTDMHSNIETILVPEPYVAPEEHDPTFTKISGKAHIYKNCEVVTENVLDMLHISFIHSFGNANAPLPFSINYENIGTLGGKTTFLYKAADNTISRNLGNSKVVIVENEFYLPSTTVTRVTANHIVKTVVTRALPINENETILFWEVHRNFINENHIIQRIGDIILKYLMEKTLLEDIGILKQVNTKYRIGILNTKYDITILNYRKIKSQFTI